MDSQPVSKNASLIASMKQAAGASQAPETTPEASPIELVVNGQPVTDPAILEQVMQLVSEASTPTAEEATEEAPAMGGM